VNMFNMGFEISLNDLKDLTQHKVTLLGNIPPRDVLARGTREDVVRETMSLLDSLKEPKQVIFSCGGGMPPGVTSENLAAFVKTVRSYRPSRAS